MINKLYISDLDGTLLNSKIELSDYTKNTLNSVIEKGVNFTVATARTAATVLKMLEDININIPIVLMNGVCVYDIKLKEYIKIETIEKASLLNMFNVFRKYNLDGFVYSIDNNQLFTFYERVNSPNAEEFIRQRKEKYGKAFTHVDDFTYCLDKSIVYYSVSDKKEILDPVYMELKKDSKINIEYYRDIYEQDFWYLEICSCKASKYNAITFLKDKLGFDHVVAFGDNLNDISMFKACEESYAVSNAKDEVKEYSTGVIGSNNDNAVAVWLEENV